MDVGDGEQDDIVLSIYRVKLVGKIGETIVYVGVDIQLHLTHHFGWPMRVCSQEFSWEARAQRQLI